MDAVAVDSASTDEAVVAVASAEPASLKDRLMFFAAASSGNLLALDDMLTAKEVPREDRAKWTWVSTVVPKPASPLSTAAPVHRAKVPDVNTCLDPVRARPAVDAGVRPG